MKKVASFVAVASIMAASTAFALTWPLTASNKAGDGLVKSKHNMQLYTDTVKDVEGRVCAFCHTPHHALDNSDNSKVDYLPLWSHKLTTQNYAPYQSPTVNVAILNPLTGATSLCMSCHDGVVAVDQHYGNDIATNKLDKDSWGGTAIGLANGNGEGSLNNDHPMGFLYKEAYDNHPGDLAAETATFITNNGKTGKAIKDGLQAGFFTCASCHDVHNKDNVASTYPGAQRNYFLYGDNNGSAFCLSCHLK